MFGFGRKRRDPTVLTGVVGTLRASHRDRDSGRVHEHEWRITVWLNDCGQSDGLMMKARLDEWISLHAGTCLPDRIAWAEDMAARIAVAMRPGFREAYGGTVRSVLIERDAEGLCALWMEAA